MTGCSIRNQNGFPQISRLSVGRSGRAGCRWTRDWGAGSPPPRSGGQVFEVPSKLTAFQSVKSQIRLGDAFTSEIPNTRVEEQPQSSALILLAETALTQLREAERSSHNAPRHSIHSFHISHSTYCKNSWPEK